MAVRFSASIARPNGDEIWNRLAIRRMSADTLDPAPWYSAGLKNTASPFAQRHLNLVLGEEVDELGPVEGHVAAEELLRVGQQHRRPALDRHVAMSHCALQSQHRRRAVQVRRICRKVVGCD